MVSICVIMFHHLFKETISKMVNDHDSIRIPVKTNMRVRGGTDVQRQLMFTACFDCYGVINPLFY